MLELNFGYPQNNRFHNLHFTRITKCNMPCQCQILDKLSNIFVFLFLLHALWKHSIRGCGCFVVSQLVSKHKKEYCGLSVSSVHVAGCDAAT